jgi:ApaG protein
MNNINIRVSTNYIKEQSQPEAGRFVYSYTITLNNEGLEAAKLIGRHWIITDARDSTQEVQGIGVVGEQPRLEPGEEYTYTSGVVLETETGSMHGTYEMQNDEGTRFNADIPAFVLVPPHAMH